MIDLNNGGFYGLIRLLAFSIGGNQFYQMLENEQGESTIIFTYRQPTRCTGFLLYLLIYGLFPFQLKVSYT
jgi:hypothetical protein